MTAGLILTFSGANEIEAAYQAGETVKITLCSFGDGGGEPVTADPSATALKGRFGEVPLSAGDAFDGMIGGMAIIPCADYPGKIVREFGLESESGTLIAYGAYPETYLPAQGDSVIKELVVKFVMPLVHAENVTLIVDPNIAIITQEEGDKRYYRRALRLQEVQDEGAAAQQELRENIGCGTSATKDIVTSPTDTTAGRVPTVGYHGLGGVAPRTAVAASNNYDNIPTGLTSGFWTHAVSGGPYAYTFTLFQDGGAKTQSRHLIIPSDPNGKIAFRWDGATATDSKDYQYFFTDKNPDTSRVAKAGDTMTDKLIMNVDGEAIRLKPKTAGGASYILSQDSAGANNWYVGAGSNNNNDVQLVNYKAANSMVQLKADGSIYVVPTNGKAVNVPGQITVSETGKGMWVNQNTSGAPLYQNINNAATSEYWPIFKQHYTQANSTWSGGTLIDEGDFHLHYLNSTGATTNFSFRKDGQFIPGSYANFDARYIQNIQLGGERSQGTHDALATSKAPAGHVLNGIKSNYNDGNWEVDTIYFKPIQKYINGTWVTITG